MKSYFCLILLLTSLSWAQTEQVQSTDVTSAITAAPVQKAAPPVPTVLLNGDFRYRLQSEKQGLKEARKIQRIQAKLQATAEVQDDLKVTLRLMTGSAANSGNQTLGDEKAPGSVRRSFGLDQAFFDYKPFSFWNLYGGKMPQPFTFAGKNQIILDRDITLEGVATKFKIPLDPSFNLIAQGGTFFIRENYDSTFNEDTSDNMFNGGQLALQWKHDDWDIIAGYGTFAFTGLKDTPPSNLTAISPPNTGANGNTLDLLNNYPNNFDLQEYFFEVKKKVSDFDFGLFYEIIKNTDIDDLNKAAAYGFSLGYQKWTLNWTQEKIEKDAVVGLFTDSDFAGGQTSSKGTIASLNYKFNSKVQIQYTVFKNENTIDIAPTSYERSHLDLMINF